MALCVYMLYFTVKPTLEDKGLPLIFMTSNIDYTQLLFELS